MSVVHPSERMPSDLKAIVMAYNAPKGEQPVRVVNTFSVATSKTIAQRVKKDIVVPKGPRVWKCPECDKYLSSKRSFNEHLNIHNQQRPFQCEYCEYAAASQMTLRRHVLRSHTNPRDWGYRCPYCAQAYMEPASYQQHIQSKHKGKSCTYGCPYILCPFVSKCFRHFREHIVKHDASERYSGPSERHPFNRTDQELICYIIDDEIGEGYKGNVGTAVVPRRRFRIKPMKPTVIYTNNLISRGPPILERSDYPPQPQPVQIEIDDQDFMKQPLPMRPRKPILVNRREPRIEYRRPRVGESDYMPADTDWIEGEVEVVASEPHYADGQEDYPLD